MRTHYKVYGLHLSANVEIPGLNAEKVNKSATDIQINLGFWPDEIKRLKNHPSTEYHLEPGDDRNDPPHLVINLLEGGKYFHFHYEYGVEFVLDHCGTTVWATWIAPSVLEDAALFLLGPIIGFMLRLRGTTCLHASGVAVNGQSFALTGFSGAGKSTLAASFAAGGFTILTDDILPLIIDNDAIYTQSGYSRLRLLPNSFENSQELPDSLPLLARGWGKHYLDLASDSYRLYKPPTVLKVVYIIDWDSNSPASPSIETLAGASAFTLLAANTYRNELLSPEMRANEFMFLSQLVSRVKVKKLHPVDDILAVPQLCDMILKDFQKETGEQPASPINGDKDFSS